MQNNFRSFALKFAHWFILMIVFLTLSTLLYHAIPQMCNINTMWQLIGQEDIFGWNTAITIDGQIVYAQDVIPGQNSVYNCKMLWE